MATVEKAPSPSKPSASLRPSRLPILKTRSSQLFQTKVSHSILVDVTPPPPSPTLRKLPPRVNSVTTPRSARSPTKPSAAAVFSHEPISAITKKVTKQPLAARNPLTQTSQGYGRRTTPAESKSVTQLAGDENQDLPSSCRAVNANSPHDRPHGPRSEASGNARSVNAPAGLRKGRKPPRPSLSDRAIESLQKLPSTPQERRRSNFFSPVQSPMDLPTRSKPNPTSSATLREHINAAKAAARQQNTSRDAPEPRSDNGIQRLDPLSSICPPSQGPQVTNHLPSSLMSNRMRSALLDGRLNVAAMDLKTIPRNILRMYDTASIENCKVNWAETVDMSVFIVANNGLEDLGDEAFPDASNDDLMNEETALVSTFRGLESLDAHANMLSTLPLGFRRLERLTSLNLAHNKLDNTALDCISQILSLRDLRLGHNAFTGSLPNAICRLTGLEKLDLQDNRLLHLPEGLRELVSLRTLNVARNQLTSLPSEAMQHLPLVELDASFNSLVGALFTPSSASSYSQLETLDVSNNSLAALSFSDLQLPAIRSLAIGNNLLHELPAISAWTELCTLTAAENAIENLPSGFATLRKLRNVNFANNQLQMLDAEIGLMAGLETLILDGNPLREKRYLRMTTHDVKRDLQSQHEPAANEDSNTAIHTSTTFSHSQKASWSLRRSGLLDLASQSLSDDINDTLGSFLKTNPVKTLHLQHNNLTAIPPALWLGQDLRILDLSSNPLIGSDYLSDELSLPSLQELSLSGCRLPTLEPLTSQLSAPALRLLNISANRLTGRVPHLRATYPALTTLLAHDNKFTAISAAALRGLQTVNLASNELEQLPAEVGLLWEEGLRSLEVGRNAFRVPGHRVLEKGTEATLRWLREKLPVGDERSEVQGAERPI